MASAHDEDDQGARGAELSSGLGAGWAPLAHPVFRSLWIANVVSLIGTWCHELGAAWLMTSLTADPLMVSLVQAATTLPMFLLAIPAGALADVVDRRRLLLATQSWSCVAAAFLGLLTLTGGTGTLALLALTFAMGLGVAASAPAWFAVLSELVPVSQVPVAVTLNGVAMNVSRAVGPALGGAVIAAAGPAWAFFLNAASYLGLIATVYRWDRPRQVSALPAERLFGAMRAGIRYVRFAPELRAVLWRSAAFVLGASAFWALLPLLARAELGRGPQGYGFMVGSVGVGALTTATFLPAVRRRDPRNRSLAAAWLLFAAALLTLAHLRVFPAVCLVLWAAGAAWMLLLTSFIAGAQLAAPTWVRGRAMSVHLLSTFGGLALGSAFWGYAARLTSVPRALELAAAALALGFAATRHLRIPSGGRDLTPFGRWREAQPPPAPLLARGPVAITVEYQIDPRTVEGFLDAMRDVREIRLRDGAIRWELYSDPADPERYQELFVVESWAEHLRQHERLTAADREVLKRCHSYHRGEPRQKVSHWLAEPVAPRRPRS
ncbi:MAG: MFS transporter [Deltaproteobacteria bacterium]|nr:MFS transporter [Deltaproteobacteria bacterium]